MVRVSFGAYNTPEDVDVLVEALLAVTRGDYRGRYRRTDDGEYAPLGYTDPPWAGRAQNDLEIPVRMDERVVSCASFTLR